MKRNFLPLLLLTTSLPALADFDEQAETDQAMAATAAFGKALKSELMAAMQSGGPVSAIAACNEQAPAIAQSVSQEKGLNISRVSLKNRNPENAPNEWQSRVLQSFEKRKNSGENPASLSWQEIVPSGDGMEFRFMKAIPTGGLCLQCHGQSITPPVAEKLAELYPQDKATGYQQGDLRGSFVVTKQIEGS